MTYLSDTMRVEMSLPVHMMLGVLVAGANCADPGEQPSRDHRELPHMYAARVRKWQQAWLDHNKRRETDPEFAKSYETFQQTKALLVEACSEALKGLYPRKKELSVLSRIERVHKEAVEPYLKGDDPDPRKIGLIAFYLVQHLVDTGTLIVPEESSFGKALETMLPALSPWEGSTDQEVADFDRLNRSAQKQVRKMVQHLQEEGYYQGIPLPDFGGNNG